MWTHCAAKLNAIRTKGAEKTPNGCRDHWTLVSSFYLTHSFRASCFSNLYYKLKSAYVAVDWLRHKASGFGWDEERSVVTALDDVWDRLVSTDFALSTTPM